jgi:hypothetical protein
MSDAPATVAPPPTELASALALFERGDFRGARAEASAIVALHPRPEVETAARALLARIAPDPWALRFGLLALALLALVVGLYVR